MQSREHNGCGDAQLEAMLKGMELNKCKKTVKKQPKKEASKPPKNEQPAVTIPRRSFQEMGNHNCGYSTSPDVVKENTKPEEIACLKSQEVNNVKPSIKTKNLKRLSHSRTVSQSSGLSELNVGELEEAFSSTEDERENDKPCLEMPHPRARTLSGQWVETGFSPTFGGASMCFSCLQFFNLPAQIPEFKDHLLREHKIIISELEAIVDPKRYVGYWRCRFNKESVDKIFPRVETTEDDPLHSQTNYYYHIGPELEEDTTLRRNLAFRRLEEVLACQQRERDDKDFKLQCIFCRYIAYGNRSKMIHHLVVSHRLNLGKPDNLVFVREYLETLRKVVDKNACIFCEEVLSSKVELMEHMRAKKHKEVNPKDHYYDKFYIINYLEVGKRWLDVLALDYEDPTIAFQDSDDEIEE